VVVAVVVPVVVPVVVTVVGEVVGEVGAVGEVGSRVTVRSVPCASAKLPVMSTPINIPKLGVSMTEGTLVEWLVSDGQQVQPGDVLYRIETDKVENEIEAPVAGTIRLLGVEGETYEVGTQIGAID
jgi:biotin carboxyl carrier protein